MSKIITLAIAGGAYVLGARAGHERYQQITGRASKLWHDPRVRDKAAQAGDLVKDVGQPTQEGR